MYLHTVSDPSAPPKPTIEASVKSFRAGENFAVTCTVLGDLDIGVDFTWAYPGQKVRGSPGIIVLVLYYKCSSVYFYPYLNRSFINNSMHILI